MYPPPDLLGDAEDPLLLRQRLALRCLLNRLKLFMRLYRLFTSQRLFPFFLCPLLSVLLDQVPDDGHNGGFLTLPTLSPLKGLTPS